MMIPINKQPAMLPAIITAKYGVSAFEIAGVNGEGVNGAGVDGAGVNGHTVEFIKGNLYLLHLFVTDHA